MVGLMLIVSGAAHSGGKEYTLKNCANPKDNPNCSECGEVKGKASFKVNKSISSVMKDIVRYDNGKEVSSVIDNCKIFDNETFECVKIEKISPIIEMEAIDVLSNGKWSMTFRNRIDGYVLMKVCGEEIN